ncbi:MAG: glycosyltransferase, partial [Candidatus Thiodiazotropha sp.]
MNAHIKIADRGWILEKCASEIIKIAPYISCGVTDRGDAELQYYINYSAYKKRMSAIELAFFTHIEEDIGARRRFLEVAGCVDYCVCMCDRYAQVLRDKGIQNVCVIPPGVDLQQYTPRLRIGVIGRTYHTGRKGEALVEKVMDIDGIDWFFTGSGWPGPALNLDSKEMAEFYNSLDYVLVPAKYEGGPMSVLEGLACGKEIISSDVGWVPNFPHIPFENGNPGSLRAVLKSLLAKRYELRASVENYTWDAWGTAHLDLFNKLLSKANSSRQAITVSTVEAKSSQASKPVIALATHGNEKGSKGGPSIRVPRTVSTLAEIGVNAIEYGTRLLRPDLIHLFNIWPASSSRRFLEEIATARIPSVFSPIFLNLTTHQLFSRKVPEIYENNSGEALNAQLAEIYHNLADQPNRPIGEPHVGYNDDVRQIVQKADHLILLSDYERQCLDFLDALKDTEATVVRNPVNADIFDGADPDLFRATYGLNDYILQVGRIEPRKNQLQVAEACRRLGVTSVFIGHEGDPAYAKLLRRIAGPSAHFVPRLQQTDPLFASAVVGASAFCLPSWAEGAPLAALEAGAAGVPLVLSDRSGEREYFGEHALYVNPADMQGMMQAIDTAMKQTRDEATRAARAEHIRTNFAWERHARATAAVYDKLLAHSSPLWAAEKPAATGRIFFDVTDWAYAGEQLEGTARVQQRQFQSLSPDLAHRIVPVAWRRSTDSLFILNREEIDDRNFAQQLAGRTSDHPSTLDATNIAQGDRLYSCSGAWIYNQGHFDALLKLKRCFDLPIGLVVHDLVRVEFAHLYDGKLVKTFDDRLTELARTVDCLMTYSQATERSLSDFLSQKAQFTVSYASFALGEDILVQDTLVPAAPSD